MVAPDLVVLVALGLLPEMLLPAVESLALISLCCLRLSLSSTFLRVVWCTPRVRASVGHEVYLFRGDSRHSACPGPFFVPGNGPRPRCWSSYPIGDPHSISDRKNQLAEQVRRVALRSSLVWPPVAVRKVSVRPVR